MLNLAEKSKAAAKLLCASTNDERSAALTILREELIKHKDEIIKANKEDCNIAAKSALFEDNLKRLTLTEDKLNECFQGILNLITKEDPLGKCLLATELSENLNLYKVTTPIGVVAVIFEARPEAGIQIASLCLKSGNALILKGGKEAAKSNQVIYEIIKESGVPLKAIQFVDSREEIYELLKLDRLIDLVVPRGSAQFVQFVKDHTKIPVLGHAEGLCSLYLDRDADVSKAIKICIDSKTQYPAACNSCETLLIHCDLLSEFLPLLKKCMPEVKMHADRVCMQFVPDAVEATWEDFRTEFGRLELAIKSVNSVEEAILHINNHGSGHTDVIVTENMATADKFMNEVDSAGVFHNASSRFADGFRYGFGAEVGISTNKIHSRGPVGLEGLLIYKYKLKGDGHIVSEYSNGTRKFTHQQLK